MKLEVFPYRFRGKAKAAALYRRGGGCLEVHGAQALFELYNSGVSFRPMPGTPFEAVVFDLDEVSPEYANKLDNLSRPGIFVAKSPSAVLEVDGKLYRRKVFYQLSEPVKFGSYGEAYIAAFARFILDAGLPLLPCDQCMHSPRQMTFGKPFPEMDKSIEKVPIEGLTNVRPPLPLSRYMAKAIFGIDDDIPLPPIEFYARGPVPEGERHAYIWQRIVPAAFSWFRYFENTIETRWGLNQAGYQFKDCEAAIRTAMLRIGVSPEETEAVIRGALYEAYTKFKAPTLTYYRPRVTVVKQRKPAVSRWSKKTEAEKQRTYARQKENRHRKRFLHRQGVTERSASPGRPRNIAVGSLDELEALWTAGKISKPYYYRLRKELGGEPRKRGRPPKPENPGRPLNPEIVSK